MGTVAKAWTVIPNLTASWVTSGPFTLRGSITFQVGATAPSEVVAISIDNGNPMIWTPNVKYPNGSISLTYTNAALMGTATDSATVQFQGSANPPTVTIGGATMNLGQ